MYITHYQNKDKYNKIHSQTRESISTTRINTFIPKQNINTIYIEASTYGSYCTPVKLILWLANT